MLTEEYVCAQCEDFDKEIERIRTQCRATARRAGWDSPLANHMAEVEQVKVDEVMSKRLDHRIKDHLR